jgi:hypothetical protein
MPDDLHDQVLYRDLEDLITKLEVLLTHLPRFAPLRRRLAQAMQKFAWENCIERYDEALEKLAQLN